MDQQKKEVTYKCECCGKDFISYKVRTGEKLCADCIGIRRALKRFVKPELSGAEVLKRGKKLLGVTEKKEEIVGATGAVLNLLQKEGLSLEGQREALEIALGVVRER